MEPIMSRASELLQQLVDEGKVPKWMAAVTGYSYQQTWKYIQGEVNPTCEFLNRLFYATADLRIPDLVMSGRRCLIHVLDLKHPAISDQPGMLSEIIEQRQKELDRERYVLQILADNKIDQSDRQAVEAFKKAFWDSIRHSCLIYDSITAAFDKSANPPAREGL